MLQLRYNGCSDCLHTAKSLLRNAGYFANRNYTVEFHKEHMKDRIYQKRPDYIKTFSGAIIYNPKTEAWLGIYDNEHVHCVACDMPTDTLKKLIRELESM